MIFATGFVLLVLSAVASLVAHECNVSDTAFAIIGAAWIAGAVLMLVSLVILAARLLP